MAFRAARVPRSLNRIVSGRPAARTVAVKAQDAVAAPYANGLIELAQERDILEGVHNDLLGMQAMLAIPSGDDQDAKNELRDFLLGNPLNPEKKKEVIDSLASETDMQKTTVDFLKLLIDVNRMDAVEDIINAFEEKYNKATDTQIVTLRSAARLEQEQEFEIAKQLQEITQSKNIKIKPVIDEDLIGGFVLQFGDNQVDLSIKGHLDRIESELMNAAVAV